MEIGSAKNKRNSSGGLRKPGISGYFTVSVCRHLTGCLEYVSSFVKCSLQTYPGETSRLRYIMGMEEIMEDNKKPVNTTGKNDSADKEKNMPVSNAGGQSQKKAPSGGSANGQKPGKEALEKKREARRKHKKRMLVIKSAILVVLLCVLGVAIFALSGGLSPKEKKPSDSPGGTVADNSSSGASSSISIPVDDKAAKIAEAERMAVQYDYEGAIAKLNEIPDANSDADIITKLAEYQSAQSSLVATDPTKVTHVFYHSLVVDPQKAFFQPGDLTNGFCQWMTTIDEFNRITQQMYDKGYVLVDLKDLVEETTDENGVVHIKKKQIMLPPGKIPFVLSLDDLSYYHSYDGRGIASKMVLDENGKPTCEYIQDDGTVVTGAYDCVPLLDQFIEEHPDFSYKGAKGTIALTGYNGILGYRTDIAYKTRENLGKDQQAWLDAHPDFNWEAECEEAKKVADALKADGWKFASHTWGHMHIGDASLERVQEDTEKWLNYVEPLVGETDVIIFAHGQDLASWNEEYSSTEKFQYLKSKGFNIFCNVDSSQYFVQSGDLFFRMGRRNLDGYRLYQSVFGGSDRLNDLMDPSSVWDQRRPTDVGLYTI